MKLRQKLAAVLATAMIATSVPVVTMASSENTLTNGISIKEKDVSVNAGNLKISMKDATDVAGAMFFVNLGNAKWDIASGITTVAGLTDVTVEYQKNGDKELQVTVKKLANDGMEDFTIPLQVKLTGGDATIAVDANGTIISNMAPIIFAKTSDAKATVTVEDAKNINKSGIVADVNIDEALLGSMGQEMVTVSLDNTDYEFTAVTTSNIALSKGFSGKIATIASSSTDELKFSLNSASTVAPGRITLKNVTIKAKNGKTPTIGENITVTVSGDKVTETTVKVAVEQQFGNTIEMKDKKAVDVVAGKKQKVTFSVKENVNDSILEGRSMEVRFDKAFLGNTTSGALTTLATTLTNSASIDTLTGAAAVKNLTLATDKDDKVIGFDFQVVANALSTTDTDEIKFTDVELFVPVNVTGEVKVSADGRALGGKLEAVALNVKAPVQISSEAYTLKVGLKDQKGGKLVITETDKAMLQQGKDLEITIDKKDSGFLFTDEPVITVTGDLQLDLDNVKVSTDGEKITIPVKRTSKVASTITITEMPMQVDRTVPEGKYDLKISGAALVSDCTFETLKVEDFIVVGTPNTEDLAANGLRKGIASFVIGAKEYTVNGIKQVMDGASYISNGRTMVPVRYVANALGVNASDIYFANGTVTVIAGTKTISLKLGSTLAYLNGAPVRTMVVAPVIKDGRTYVPVSEIGALLGINATWNETAKTATFENK